ncbi:microtubule-associated protein 1S-like [Ylistrum balloti]|uniref:microtubule-associated protein 1S-like n=1 Tax=Ylistrum balloti TaxID=509963 RepID=UPI002905C010|nr:microtubule-associated protein 1S-like [Ylistrum balloti]
METDGVSPQTNWETDSPVGAAVLLVIGEPVTDDHQNVILGEITKGFRCWDEDQTGIDINDELARIANRASMGEEGPNDERTIQHRSEKVAMEILVNPRLQTLQQSLQTFLMMPAGIRHLIYAGHYFGGSGSWVLQDDCFTVSQLGRLCKDSDIEAALKQQDGGKMTIYCNTGGEWKSSNISKLDVCKSLTLELNPEEKLSDVNGILQFTTYIGSFIHAKTIQQLMRTSDVVGNIRFSKPTLYIFPACEGDSAMFGISGFNLLVNGGYSRKSCFWDFARHLDRIDAVLMTHLGADNIFGISSVLRRKSMETIHPDIGFMYLNASDKAGDAELNGFSDKEPQLAINLAEEGSKLLEFSKNLIPTPQPCSRVGTTSTVMPVNLYHKVGHGSLDMYILNPVSDSKELKDFYQQWNKQVMEFGSTQNVPLPNMLSICCLLVWQPSDPDADINRLFFPGNAPQHKIIEGLEKLKHLKFLKKATCTPKDLEAKPAPKKASGSAGRPASAKTAAKPTPEKKVENKSTPRPAATSRSNKVSKEDENKKKAEDKITKSKPSLLNKTASKSTKADPPAPKKPASSTPKKPSPTEAKKKPMSTQSPRPSAKKEAEKSTPSKQKTPSPERKSPMPVASVAPVVASQEPLVEPVQEVVPPAVDLLSGTQTSLIDITPEEPLKSMADTLVPQQEPLVDSEKKSESPDPLPDPNQYEVAPDQGESSLMYGSFHQDLQNDLLAPQDVSVENGDHDYETGLIQPESLPEPVAYSPQEPDLIPEMSPITKEPLCPEVPQSNVGDIPVEPDVVPSFKNEPDFQPSVQDVDRPVSLDDVQDQVPSDPPSRESPDMVEENAIQPAKDNFDLYATNYKMEADTQMEELKQVSPVDEANVPDFQKQEDVITDGQLDMKPAEQLEKDMPEQVEEDVIEQKSHVQEEVMPADPLNYMQEEQNVKDQELDVHEEMKPADLVDDVAEEQNIRDEELDVHEETKPVDPVDDMPKEQNIRDEELDVHEEIKPADPVDDVAEEQNIRDEELDVHEEIKPADPVADMLEEQNLKDQVLEDSLDNMPEEQEEDVAEQVHDVQEDVISADPLEDMPEKEEVLIKDSETPEVSPFAIVQEQPQEKADVSDHALDDVDDEDEGDVSPDEMDSQGDVRETVLPEDDTQEDVSPYAFENKGFTEASCEEVGDEPSTEPVEDFQSDDGHQCADAFEKDEDIKDDLKELEETEDVADGGAVSHDDVKVIDDSLEESQQQNGDYLEVSNIPEAFEKDETPDPVDLKSEDSQEEDEGLPEQDEGNDDYQAGAYSSLIGMQEKQPEPSTESNFNPFTGINDSAPHQASPADGAAAAFDPFLPDNTQSTNPFTCSGQPLDPFQGGTNGQGFDPKEWGEPMGLPAPPPPEGSPGPTANGKATEKSTHKAKSGATKRPDSAKLNRSKLGDKPEKNGAPSTTKTAKTNGVKSTTTKARPSSAATSSSSESKAKSTGRRPATATGSRASPATFKSPPLPPMTPFYMDLSYIPNHGNPQYSDIEFFKRIRARYYVLSSLSPNSQVLNALLDAKQTWEDKDLKVTIIPTYDNDTIRHWMGLNKDRLCDLNVDVAPSASRCTIQLQDHETSCSAFRLEF